MDNQVVSKKEWLAARKALLVEEKAFTKRRDVLTKKIRSLPWVKISSDYSFETEKGPARLAELFGDSSQLMVYHFMFGPDWQAGCKSCSFWADNFDGITKHLKQRDVKFWAISTAPLATLLEFRKRMGWQFDWASSGDSDFNLDLGVSFPPGEKKGIYNYRETQVMAELPGLSVFAKKDGEVYHTYSAYSRGLDIFNGAYNFLDVVPKGRDEAELSYSMEWLRLKDSY